jgi:hypothetical protein
MYQKTQYTKFTQPNGVELKHPVYDGVGNREKFLTHTSSALEVVEARWGSRRSTMHA